MPELLDAAVTIIEDIDVTFHVHGQSDRVIQLTVADTFSSPLGQESALVIELLDAVVAIIGDIDVTLFIYGYPPKPMPYSPAMKLN